MRSRAARPSTGQVPGWRRSAHDVSRHPTAKAKRRRSAPFGLERGREAGAAERGDLLMTIAGRRLPPGSLGTNQNLTTASSRRRVNVGLVTPAGRLTKFVK